MVCILAGTGPIGSHRRLTSASGARARVTIACGHGKEIKNRVLLVVPAKKKNYDPPLELSLAKGRGGLDWSNS